MNINDSFAKGLLRPNGENNAVRAFLFVYNSDKVLYVGRMRTYMSSGGWADCWPLSVHEAHADYILGEKLAQEWLRYLFDMERTASAILLEHDQAAQGIVRDAERWAVAVELGLVDIAAVDRLVAEGRSKPQTA